MTLTTDRKQAISNGERSQMTDAEQSHLARERYVWLQYENAQDKAEQQAFWRELQQLHAQRPESLVRRLEQERNLR